MLTSVSLVWKWVSSMAVPKLRFKDCGGREFPEWEDKKLGEFFSKINKKNSDNLIRNVITNSAVNGLIEQRKFFDKDIANKENTDKYYIIEKGDFVYNPRKSNVAPYGPVRMYESDCKGIVSPLYLCFKPIDKTLSLLFMKNYFKSSSWHKYIYANGDTGARDDRVSVKVTTFLDMPVNIPSFPEQQKIADFLTAYDTMIDTQTKRVEVMKLRKKGLLQKIFSQEIRFKDDEGREFPEWESKPIGKRCKLIRGQGLNKEDLSESGVNKVILYGQLYTEYNEVIQKVCHRTNVSKEKMIISEAYDILIPGSDTTPTGLARACCVIEKGVILGGDINVLRPLIDDGRCLSYCINANKKMLIPLIKGSTVRHLQNKDIADVLLFMPSLPEQQKIADFLTAVDKQIEVEEKRLETMKTIKKGLLQQMFV